MIILLIILLYPLIVGVVGLELNSRGLLPGTRNYCLAQQVRQSQLQAEQARTAAISARYREKENEHLDSIKVKLLEAAK